MGSAQSSSASATAAAASPASAIAHTAHKSPARNSQKQREQQNEPLDRDDRTIDSNTSSNSERQYATAAQDQDELIDHSDIEGEYVPESAIPAAGRGNSDDGQSWLNPSANQLYRALKRKHKPIDKTDAMSVANVHNAVTDNTWMAIMEYEDMHKGECEKPTLARFQGMDGIYSYKAQFVSLLTGGQLPFDRHDWFVDRCGQKEIKYVIDYYSVEERDAVTGAVDVAYFVDARPAPSTVGGVYDRMRMATRRYKAGESMW